MIRRFLVATLACLAPIAAHAEMLTDDMNGVKIGMTPRQVIAVLQADFGADPVVTTRPCGSGDRYARTCVTAMSAGPPTNQTSVFFVEDLPSAPGAMRVYAAVSITLSEPWTDRDSAAWEAVVSRDLGRPDCVQLGNDGRFRAWSREGASSCAALPLPESEDLPPGVAGFSAASRVTVPVIWEFQANTGRLHQLVLIDLGFYQSRKRAAGGR